MNKNIQLLLLSMICMGNLFAAENRLQYEIVPFDYYSPYMTAQLCTMVHDDKDIQNATYLDERVLRGCYLARNNTNILVSRSINDSSIMHHGFMIPCMPSILADNRRSNHIAFFAVHKDYRQKGIAQAMLKKFEENSLKQGISCLTVNVHDSNAIAIAAYRKFGFEIETDVDDCHEKGTNYLMIKKIDKNLDGKK